MATIRMFYNQSFDLATDFLSHAKHTKTVAYVPWMDV